MGKGRATGNKMMVGGDGGVETNHGAYRLQISMSDFILSKMGSRGGFSAEN